jgi:hypothetical protein
MNWSDLTNPVRPGPVREKVCYRKVGAPMRLIQKEAIFLETSQIDDSIVGAARGVIRLKSISLWFYFMNETFQRTLVGFK